MSEKATGYAAPARSIPAAAVRGEPSQAAQPAAAQAPAAGS
jgi:hypothetical protein